MRFDRKLLTSDRRGRAVVSNAVITKVPTATNSTAALDINEMAAAFSNTVC